MSGAASTGRASRGTVFDGLVVAAAATARSLHELSEGSLKAWDEGLYCAATEQMRRAGQWLYAVHEGHFDGYYGKPPLINWLHYLSTTALGWSPFSLRLPTALATAATIVLAWALAVRLAGRAAGAVAASLLLVSTEYLTEGRTILLEPLLAVFALAAILVHDAGASRGGRAGLAGAVVAGAFCAAGILTKQVLGVFPVAAILGTELLRRRPGFASRCGVFVVATLALSGWWFVLVHEEVGERLVRSFFERHVVARVEGTVEGHANTPTMYAGRLAAYAPAIVLPGGLLGLFGLLRYGRSPFASVALVLLFLGHYVVHALVAKTMLVWYPWPMVPVLAVGAATLLTETFALDRSGVLRWFLPLAMAMGYARAAEWDPIAFGLAATLVACVVEVLFLRTGALGAAAPTLLVLAALATSFATMPPPREPWIPGTLARIDDPRDVVVLLEHPTAYVPRCYFPDARILYFRGPRACAEAAAAVTELEARDVLSFGRLARCPAPAGFHSTVSGRHHALYERDE